MSAGYLLDSDVIIWNLRGHQAVRNVLRALPEGGQARCSVLSCFEVWSGAFPEEEQAVAAFLATMNPIPVDDAIARQGAEYWRRFRRHGITLGKVDAMIAATARVHGLALLTYNRAHYPMRDVAFFGPMPPLV